MEAELDTPKITNVIAVTTFTRRDHPRLNCLQQPLMWNGQTPYQQHFAKIMIFFELIFMSLIADPMDAYTAYYGKEKIAARVLGEQLYLLLGWLSVLNDLLVARYLETIRIKPSGKKAIWPCIGGKEDIDTQFGRLFYRYMYIATRLGDNKVFVDSARHKWDKFNAVQGGRRNLPPQFRLYRQLVDENGKSLAELCVEDSTIPQMTLRACTIGNLHAVQQTEQTIESPFNYRNKVIYSQDFEFYNADGDEIDPHDGTKKPPVPRFDFDDTLNLFGNPDVD